MNERKFQRKLEKIKKQGERYRREYEVKAAYEKYLPEKKKKKVSNIMLVVSVTAIIAYTVASFLLQNVAGVEISSTLTTCFYAYFGGELFVLAGIKVSKVIKESGIGTDSCDDVDYENSNETFEEDYGEDVAG